MLEQTFRDQYAHYFNTTPKSEVENWVREQVGVEALSMSFNANVDQYKTIGDRNASATFQNYQIQSSISGKRIYKGDAIYEFLNEARKKATAIETQLLEVDMADATEEGAYSAIKYNILITIDEFLGENATISYSFFVQGDPTLGTATISGGKPAFVPSVK